MSAKALPCWSSNFPVSIQEFFIKLTLRFWVIGFYVSYMVLLVVAGVAFAALLRSKEKVGKRGHHREIGEIKKARVHWLLLSYFSLEAKRVMKERGG